jgi:hypothetical protein
VDSTNYFVDHGARLLAALRVGIGLSPGLSLDRNAYLVEASQPRLVDSGLPGRSLSQGSPE